MPTPFDSVLMSILRGQLPNGGQQALQQQPQEQQMPQQGFQTPYQWLALTMHNSGQSWSDTLAKAAAITQNQQKVDNENYEFQVKQQQMIAEQQRKEGLAELFSRQRRGGPPPSLDEILRLSKGGTDAAALYTAYNENALKENFKNNIPNLEGKTATEIFKELGSRGVDAKDAAQIAADLVRQNKEKQNANQFTGADSIRYETTKDANGNLIAKPIPGQINKERPKLTPSELRINTTKLKELDNATHGAQQELRLLGDLEEAFKKFDNASGVDSLVGPGSIASKITPKWGENIAWNTEAQAAKQKIDKVNSVLYQNRIKAAGANANNIPFQNEVKKGLPTVEIQPEARKELIETKKREIIVPILRGKFFHEWNKLNNKDLSGAEDAFASFVDTAPLLKENGEINKDLIKQIPKIVESYFQGSQSQSESIDVNNSEAVPAFSPSDYDEITEAGIDLSQFDNLPEEVIEAEAKRREKMKKGNK